jgi:hypothetical protein
MAASAMVYITCNVKDCDCYIALTEAELSLVKQNAARVFADALLCAQLDGRCIVSKRDIQLACRTLGMTGANMMMSVGTLPATTPPLSTDSSSC